jgi:hypothetical protein
MHGKNTLGEGYEQAIIQKKQHRQNFLSGTA